MLLGMSSATRDGARFFSVAAALILLGACASSPATPAPRESISAPNAASASDVTLEERACDLGDARACRRLAELSLYGDQKPKNPSDPFESVDIIRARHADVVRGFGYWERACLIEYGFDCWRLREALSVRDCPRRSDDDLLPLLPENASAPPTTPAAAPAQPSSTGGGGICDIDPSACPPVRVPARAHELPAALAPRIQNGWAEHERILQAHQSACARGSAADCFRLVAIEALRLDGFIYAEEQNLARPPRFDVLAAARDLCARDNGEACVFLFWRGRADVPELVRACNAGTALGCAIAGNRLRGRGQSADAASMFSRACTGGVRWACTP
jgi:hypothetical protein